ncbi:MAG: DUF3604 domain-containing protein, partial [Akkermansiaceae bacterium]|nr:DUF3604 domain-containing protein [Akkermansiaceae bacterium]
MKTILNSCLVLTGACLTAIAQDRPSHAGELTLRSEDGAAAFKKPGYSPYAGRNYPTRVLWGETHLHTNLSLDARAGGVTLSPEEALRFARGEEVTSTHGLAVKLSRPLDFVAITD